MGRNIPLLECPYTLLFLMLCPEPTLIPGLPFFSSVFIYRKAAAAATMGTLANAN
jgi:hypothetical protein